MGCIRLRSNVRLHLESGAVLEGSRNLDDYLNYLDDKIELVDTTMELVNRVKNRSAYQYSRWNNDIMRAHYAKNISITGDAGSYINGVDCYDEVGEEGYTRMIMRKYLPDK